MGVSSLRLDRATRAAMRLISLGVVIGLAACSGGGGARALPQAGVQQSPSKEMASVTFTMHWTDGTQSVTRTPRYVPATALSVSVTVNGGIPQYLNAPASTIVIDAPV